MAKNKKQESGGWGGGDDFWGAETSMSDAPPTRAAKREEDPYLGAAAPVVKRSLMEHLKPLFLCVCEQHRISKSAKNAVSFESAKQKVTEKIDEIDKAARHDPVLRQQFEKLRDPIYWYLDGTFSSPDNGFPFRQKWIEQRLADYGEDGSLSGDDAFFDELTKELQNDANDENANERLAFYYTAIGLGFTGCFFKKSPDHRRELKDFMTRLYPRVARYVDTDATGKITPETYRFTDKRDFVAPSRDKPMIFFAAFILMLGTLLFGYVHWYLEKTENLRNRVQSLQSPSTEKSE